jgi:hypothetical protein
LRDVVRAEIRAARAHEAEMLLRIQRDAAVAAFGHIFPQDRYPFPEAAIRDDWRAALDDPMVEVYVAEVDEDVVGSVSVGYGFHRTLYVVPGHWERPRGSFARSRARPPASPRRCGSEAVDARREHVCATLLRGPRVDGDRGDTGGSLSAESA